MKHVFKISAIFLIFGTFLAKSDDIETEDDVLVLTGDNFEQALTENEFILVEFYAPWCGHCKKLAPEYAKAAMKLSDEGSAVKLGKVDATVESGLGTRFKVGGYPTLKFFRSGKPMDYKGPRDADGIVQWIEKKTGPAAVEINDLDAFNKLKADENVFVIACIKNKESTLAKEFLLAAATVEDFKLAITSNDDVIKAAESADGSLVIFKNFDDPKVTYEGEAKSADIEKWLSSETVPLVWEFTQTSAQKIFAQKPKVHLLYFIKAAGDAEKQIEPLKKVAQEFKGHAVIVYINTNEPSNEKVLQFFGVTDQQVPVYALFEMNTNAKYMAEFNTAATTEGVTAFIEKYFTGQLEKTLKSAEIPEDWDKEAVKVLVGKNFEEVAKDKSKDVFVEFYAPWCGHCKSLAPIWDKLAEEFANDESIVIAKVDATENEVDGVNIKSFPTLKLFKKDSNEIVDYSGARDFETLVHFVKTGEQKLPEKEKKEEEKEEEEKTKDEL